MMDGISMQYKMSQKCLKDSIESNEEEILSCCSRFKLRNGHSNSRRDASHSSSPKLASPSSKGSEA